jgi:hypothetical protein
MIRFSLCVVVALVAATSSWSLRAAPEAEAAAGRALMKRYADTIVGVELVVTLKLKFGDREQAPREQRIEVNGTVISPTGLLVTSLAVVDPQSQLEGMRAQFGGRGAPEIMGSDFKEVKFRFADGKEVPARFVLKDADLDLAFMAPETPEPDRVYPYVNLGEAATGTVLGNYFYVSRASKALQRVPYVRTTEVTGIVEKPRRIFLMTDQSLATAIFDAQGKVLGISLNHFANGRPTGAVVMPAEDIAEMAKQAEAAQAAAK